MVSHKICSACKVDKPASEYHRGTTPNGLYPKCKPCRFESRRKPLDECKTVRFKEDADGNLHCTDCKQWLPKTLFWKTKSNKTGYALTCTPCRKISFTRLYAESESFREERLVQSRSRSASLRMQCPPWADKAAIRAVYQKAYRKRKATGQDWVVDHDIPLRGKKVSGLHIASNLKIILQADNRAKWNSHES